MILGYRAEYLAKAASPGSKPVLMLCYNEPLAVKLAAMMQARGLSDVVHARNFHKWCWHQLRTFDQALPPQGPGMFDEMVDRVIRAVDRRQIPSGQYRAILIDEGHAWSDMAIVCRDCGTMETCAAALRRRGMPLQLRKGSGDFRPGADAVTVMTMRVSKGLEFPVVAMAGVGQMPAPDQDEKEEARLFYVGATRATHHLIIGVSGDGAFGSRLFPGA